MNKILTGSVAQKVALFIAGLICFLIFLEVLALVQIYFINHRETTQEAALVSSILRERIDEFNAFEIEKNQIPILELQQWRNLDRLNIEFISEDGAVIESNHQYKTDTGGVMTTIMKAILDVFHLKSVYIVEPVIIHSKHVGDVIIRSDLYHELKYVGIGIVELLMPILFTFILSSLLVVFLFSLILERIDGQLNFPSQLEKKSGRLRYLSILNVKRLFLRIIESSESLKKVFHIQKRKAVELQEFERKRIAAELHDELGQLLTTMRIELDKFYHSDDSVIKENTIANLKQRSERMSEILRSNLKQLRPPNLSEFGLAHCLHELVNDWIYNHPQHQLQLTINCNLRLLDEHMQLSCYRIIQESLTNISRHAGDHVKAEIILYRENNDIIINVMDNGRGCDLSLITKGYGLLGMRERVETVSGQLHIWSQPDEGMKIEVKLPCGIGEMNGEN